MRQPGLRPPFVRPPEDDGPLRQSQFFATEITEDSEKKEARECGRQLNQELRALNQCIGPHRLSYRLHERPLLRRDAIVCHFPSEISVPSVANPPMNSSRALEIARRYGQLTIGVLGDMCLDRYLEIDPAKSEISIETGLAVYNVTRVRSQPGAAGTILNNLLALGVGTIVPIGFCGDDGEGYELTRALRPHAPVDLGSFVQTSQRRTFTYCKPLIMEASGPRELNRLDSKNWDATPHEVEQQLIAGLKRVATKLDALIVMDQVDIEGTGVVTRGVLAAVGELATQRPTLPILGDSRRGLRNWPKVQLKMNRAELAALLGAQPGRDLSEVEAAARRLAKEHGREVFVTLSEDGILGAAPDGEVARLPCHPIRGPIDIVGAGDSVSANLAAALAAKATLVESLEMANAAASIVIHQVGTTGTASPRQIAAVFAV
jgi:rfaE bifunctional protein kinase chain/domain